MPKKCNLERLNDRNWNSNSFENIFPNQKRLSWPDIKANIIPLNKDSFYNNDPLNDIQKSMISMVSCIVSQNQKSIKTP